MEVRVSQRLMHLFLPAGLLPLAVLCWVCLLPGAAAAAVGEEAYPTLTVGPDVYTNVIVLNKTRSDVFIQHAHGMANLKVKELDIPTQIRLGYHVEMPPPPTRLERVLSPDVTSFENDPRVQLMEEQLVARLDPILDRLDPVTWASIVAGVGLVYLLYGLVCRAICVKANVRTSLLPFVWLPVLKQIPLFRAAGMSSAWLLTTLLPPVYAIVYMVWSFKVVQMRGKKLIYSVMLLLPGTNLLAMLYLAMASTSREEEKPDPNVISLSGSARRDAA